MEYYHPVIHFSPPRRPKLERPLIFYVDFILFAYIAGYKKTRNSKIASLLYDYQSKTNAIFVISVPDAQKSIETKIGKPKLGDLITLIGTFCSF